MRQNLTLQLDVETIRKARLLAGKRSSSISRLVASEIDRLVAEDDAYEHAKVEALRELGGGYDLGSEGRMPTREALHER